MDTTIDIDANNQNKKADSYIKMTVSRLYRVTGSTAQASGVVPDILLPDLLSARAKREADNPVALVVQLIEANKYYKPNLPINLTDLKAMSANETSTSPAFIDIKNSVEQINLAKQKMDVSLLLSDAIQLRKNRLNIDDEDNEEADTLSVKDSTSANFTIVNHSFETKRLEADCSQKEMGDGWKSFLMLDPYIKTVYKLLLLMK